jgi:hypothetical protein
MVTDNSTGEAIADATVKFANIPYITNEDGIVTLSAPFVEENTTYTLAATKDEWQPDYEDIIVINEENQAPIQVIGWISGKVTNIAEAPLEDVQVCVLLNQGNTCASTNTQGRYMLSVPLGTYTVEASTDGYITDTKEATVIKDTNTVTDFILEPIKNEIMDYVFEWGIEKEIIDADIQLLPGETSTIQIYNTAVTVEDVSTQQGAVSFTVVGPNNTTGVILLRIEDAEQLFNKKISNIENLDVKIDGISLQMASGIEQILSSSSNGNEQPIWTGIISNGQTYLLIQTSFSEHHITITVIEEVLSGFFAIGVYIAICVLLALFIVIPIYFIEKQ